MEMWARCCGGRRRVKEGTRIVRSHPYARLPSDPPSPFPNNRITNTKYTLWTFIPLNLWQQFSVNMNRYFLLIAILQLWATITPVAPITTWGPLAVIFAISGLKEGIDDTRRYRADQAANKRALCVLRDGAWTDIESQDLQVGDIIRCVENDEIPADIVLLQSSEAKVGSAYIQTSNLDGETNLKQRFTAHLDWLQPLSEEELSHLDIVIECAHPNNNLYNFDSTLKLSPGASVRDEEDSEAPIHSLEKGGDHSRFPLTGDNLLLQATYLRNTTWITGLVVYSGNETKVGCNKSKPHQKYTKLDEKINRVTAIVFAGQILLIVIWGIVGSIIEGRHREASSSTSAGSDDAWYLLYDVPAGHASKDGGRALAPLVIPLRFLLLASMMIPISLKVSLDLIKLYYSLLIGWDADLVDKRVGSGPGGADEVVRATATNTSISENLGQVRYVLSDKTGTLTENIMVLRKVCTSHGSKFGEDPAALLLAANVAAQKAAEADRLAGDERSSGLLRASLARRHRSLSSASAPNAVAVDASILSDPLLLKGLASRDEHLLFLLKTMALCNTVVPSYLQVPITDAEAAADAAAAAAAAGARPFSFPQDTPSPRSALHPHLEMASSHSELGIATVGSSSSLVAVGSGGGAAGESLPPSGSVSHFGAASETVGAQLSASSSFQGGAPAPSSPVRHSAIPGATRTVVHYASSSPDELSLVEFASQTGIRLLEKNGNTLRISIDPRVGAPSAVASSSSASASAIPAGGPQEERWEVLHVLEFSSERKRMSVLLRQVGVDGRPLASAQGQVLLLCKGADDVLFARLDGSPDHPTNPSAMVATRAALDAYASTGLRTLVFGWRMLSGAEYAAYAERAAAAALDILARDAALQASYETVERDLTLAGCTGIEDKLQVGVAHTIHTLREANIKVWMLTGDKFLTALEISKTCELYKPLKDNALPPLGASGHHAPEGDVLYTIEGATQVEVRACLDNITSRALDGITNRALHAYCLIVDGATLVTVLSPALENIFALIALQAVSVICCRTTPAQKASMVALVKKHSAYITQQQDSESARRAEEEEEFGGGSGGGEGGEDSEASMHSISGGVNVSRGRRLPSSSRASGGGSRITAAPSTGPGWFSSLFAPLGSVVLAIGDGGNDVSMIQEADVGVGIVGKEGLQASRASDYSFSKFSFLAKLILVHGRYSYNRTAFIAQYCFYKSMFICLIQLFFAFLSEFSGASFFDSYSLMTYNLFYTSLVTMLYVFEQDLSPLMLLHNPRLYAVSCQRGTGLTFGSMSRWMFRGLFQAVVLTVFARWTHHGLEGSMAFGPEGQLSNALVIYTSCVLVHPLTIALESSYITWVHHLVLWGTLGLFVLTNLALSGISPRLDLLNVYTTLLRDPEYYLRTIVLTTLCIMPVVAVKYYYQRYSPSLIQRAREADMSYRALHPRAAARSSSFAAVSSKHPRG